MTSYADQIPLHPPPRPKGRDDRRNLASTPPGRMVARLATAALGSASAGGTASAWMAATASGDPTERSLITWPLFIAMPVVLTALIIGRLAEAFGSIRSAPSGRWLVAVAIVSVLAICGAQVGPDLGWPPSDLPLYAPILIFSAYLGTFYGLIPAVVSLALLVPALLLLGPQLSPAGGQTLVTAVPMLVTAMFAALVTGLETGTEIMIGMSAALAGTGAVLSARWSLE